jgi:UDP-N-acetylglucosamine--N-acetylmuramyl-(pentapeptide) pyrophosphoryl-undecaprenol N-acetylglucosamine transferase
LETVIIAASGSGGHLLPALSIAKALENNYKDLRIVFIGSGRPLEEKLIKPAGYERITIEISGLRRLGIKGFIKWVKSLPAAINKVYNTLNSFDPKVVIGVGGYASVLPVVIAKIQGRKTIIHEAERNPGWANLFLSFFANKISCAHKDAKFPSFIKIIHTGQPLRSEILSTNFNKDYPKKPINIFITGGSQGAKSIDEVVFTCSEILKKNNCNILHQCRAENVNLVTNKYRTIGISAEVSGYVDDMIATYQWADLIISRAGANAVLEISYVGRPAILIPLPNATEQLENASAIQEKGQAIIIEEDVNLSANFKTTLEYLFETNIYQQMLEISGKKTTLLERADQKIAQLILNMLKT